MQIYRAEENAELVFHFPDGLNKEELDKQGVKLPVQMKLVDLVIERENDILLVEIKDPSHSRSQEQDRRQGQRGAESGGSSEGREHRLHQCPH